MLWMLMILLEGKRNSLYTTCGPSCGDRKLSHTQALAVEHCRRLGCMVLIQVSKRVDGDCDTECTRLKVRAETKLVERSFRWAHYDHSGQDTRHG